MQALTKGTSHFVVLSTTTCVLSASSLSFVMDPENAIGSGPTGQ